MKFGMKHQLGWAAVMVTAVALIAGTLHGAVLPPGAAVQLVGVPADPGVIIRDEFIPYEILATDGTTLFAGTVQDRIVRRGDGTLVFHKRLIDSLVDTQGAIVAASVHNYTGYVCDVEFIPPGAGGGGDLPSVATRSLDGSVITYSFANNPIFETEESTYFYAETDAMQFVVAGEMSITLATGESTTVIVASPFFIDATPEAELINRTPLQCVCNPVEIIGIADASGGAFDSYTLEYKPLTAGAWTVIGMFFAPVPAPGGTLAIWNVGGLPQGYYFLRLTVENILGDAAIDTTIIWIDQQFDNLTFAGPPTGDVVGGNVCPHGTINDHCQEEYAVEYSADGVNYQPIDPGNPVYTGPKVNQTFGVWDSTAVADGAYVLRVTAVDPCGHMAETEHEVIVDNTPPTAEITSPTNCECVEGLVEVIGTADDANLGSWALQYSGGGNNNWITINSGNTPVVDGVLGEWDTNALPDCPHVLRLVVTDTAQLNCNGAIHHISDFLVSVNVGCDGSTCPGDLNGDEVINVFDLLILLGAWGVCP